MLHHQKSHCYITQGLGHIRLLKILLRNRDRDVFCVLVLVLLYSALHPGRQTLTEGINGLFCSLASDCVDKNEWEAGAWGRGISSIDSLHAMSLLAGYISLIWVTSLAKQSSSRSYALSFPVAHSNMGILKSPTISSPGVLVLPLAVLLKSDNNWWIVSLLNSPQLSSLILQLSYKMNK